MPIAFCIAASILQVFIISSTLRTENPRNHKTTKRGRTRFCKAAIHVLRRHVQRTLTWEDTFKRLLLRFECSQQRHSDMQVLADTLINRRSFYGF
jgi:3-deoxy-D-manno-octulosonic-acid transferase